MSTKADRERAEADMQARKAGMTYSTIPTTKPSESLQGYVDGFYAIGEALGVGAKPYSPKETLERDILPAIHKRNDMLQAARDEIRELRHVVNFYFKKGKDENDLADYTP